MHKSIAVFFVAALNVLAATSRGQIYVSNGFHVGEYDFSGAPINSTLIGTPGQATGMALNGTTLYVASFSSATSGAVGEYDIATGAPINASFITGLGDPYGIALDGGYLYVANYLTNKVGKYDAAMGAPVNASFISGLQGPVGLAAWGGNLYVANYGGDSVGEYDAATGATINASLIGSPHVAFTAGVAISGGNLYASNNEQVGLFNATTGSSISDFFVYWRGGYPYGLAISGGSLYVAYNNVGVVGEYDASTGQALNHSLISGLNSPIGILVVPAVPEPSSLLLAAFALAGLLAWGWRRRGRSPAAL